MAAEDAELPADLLESMDHLDSSLDNCNEILGRLTSIPLLDMKNKVELGLIDIDRSLLYPRVLINHKTNLLEWGLSNLQ